MLLGLELTADGYRWQDDTCYMWYQNKKVIKMVSVVVRDNIPFATNEHRSMIIGPPIQIGYTIDDKWRARLGVIVRQKVKEIKSFKHYCLMSLLEGQMYLVSEGVFRSHGFKFEPVALPKDWRIDLLQVPTYSKAIGR